MQCRNSGTKPGGETEIPTYDWKCKICGRVTTAFRSIAEHTDNPAPFVCHEQPMERFFTSPGCPLLNAMISEAHYKDLKAPDGTDISSRAKHREYMRAHNLTTMDDFTETWKKAAAERLKVLEGVDPQRVWDVARAWETHHG